MKPLTKRILRTIAWIAFLAIAGGEPALAHHSLDAEYDRNAPVTLQGVVTKVAWQNPHSYIYLDVEGPAGTTVEWTVEGYPPRFLAEHGWKKDVTLKPGDPVTIHGWRAIAGDPKAHATTVTLSSGQTLLFGTEGRPEGAAGKGRGKGK